MTAAIDPFAPFRLDGRVALVTGASGGLGARFARVLAAAGATVIAVARRADRLADLVESMDGAVACPADITDATALDDLAARVGRVDILVNNAGVVDAVPAERESLEEFSSVLAINLTAAFRMCQVFGAKMLDAGSGSIVNVASVLGFRSAGQIPQAGYSASKGGLVNLSKELAAQWGGRGVRVNALCPGWFLSEMTADMFAEESGLRWVRRKTAMGRLGREHELDGALLWLASDASSYVTGSAVIVDGGFLAM